MHEVNIKTNKKEEFVDISTEISKIVLKSGIKDGTLTAFVPHTTAGITINEGADPDVKKDILSALSRIAPSNENYAHREGNSPAHIKASLMGGSVTIITKDNHLALGTWQKVFFSEFDGPRQRNVWVALTKT
ncbi:MAG: secondary thiamine-phosphate synthase enzyme YjbQ [Candidatus Aenigmarchaeota archaeon]|nr:secondary thiamine-phosphate synthase enzyme YjbQ [Candidatus Aenigmarchaeota archaeon]